MTEFFAHTDAARELEQKRYRRALVLLRLLQGAFAIAVLALLAAAVFVVVQVRSTQIEGTPTGKRIVEIAEKIDSCTDPEGECTQRGQQRTASAISDINRISIIAAACADRPAQQTLEEIQGCVIAKLAEQDRRKP